MAVNGSRREVKTTLTPTLVVLGRRHKACGQTVLVIVQSYFSVQIDVIKQLHIKLTPKYLYAHKGWFEWINNEIVQKCMTYETRTRYFTFTASADNGGVTRERACGPSDTSIWILFKDN